ncbi:hypothetical protein H7R52_00635 [Weissella confusa]|uniref:Xylulose 5-phosphate/Fructose 6-phosphate phosphoketolase N-terminal domain-containing protein n=1 Tax=Weissella confusa TaxID=1583 RepID=A0A923NDT2_WEICO|nr:hypothetical protein [Weissella confusa]
MAVDFDSKEYLAKVDAWWRATNYLSAGMIFLKSNPLFSKLERCAYTTSTCDITVSSVWTANNPKFTNCSHLARKAIISGFTGEK